MLPIYLQALSFSDVHGNSENCIRAAADMACDLGLAGIDIEDRLLKSYEPDYLRGLANQIEHKGIKFGYCGLIVDFLAPISSIAVEIDRAKKLIDAVKFLGISSIRVPGNGVVDEQTTEATFNAVCGKFQQICQYAEEKDVKVYLHNHNHGSTPSNGDQVNRMLDRITSSALSYVLDTGQFQGSPGASGSGHPGKIAKPELYDSIEACAPRAEIVRAKFYFEKYAEERWLNYPRIVGILKNVNFRGLLSIVYEPRGQMLSTEALPAAVRYLTDLFES